MHIEESLVFLPREYLPAIPFPTSPSVNYLLNSPIKTIMYIFTRFLGDFSTKSVFLYRINFMWSNHQDEKNIWIISYLNKKYFLKQNMYFLYFFFIMLINKYFIFNYVFLKLSRCNAKFSKHKQGKNSTT